MTQYKVHVHCDLTHSLVLVVDAADESTAKMYAEHLVRNPDLLKDEDSDYLFSGDSIVDVIPPDEVHGDVLYALKDCAEKSIKRPYRVRTSP